jgi:hypothetical protein
MSAQAIIEGLHGFAAVAETAATSAYGCRDHVARSGLRAAPVSEQNHIPQKIAERNEFTMITHDPFQNYQTQNYQNYQTPGAYAGGVTQFGLPVTAFQPFFNPMAVAGQPLANPGVGGNGIFPQPFQGVVGIAGQQGPFQQGPLQHLALNPLAAAALQNPWLQHPLAQGPWQNPMLAASLQNPLLNPMLAYYGWPQQQPQFNYPLAPQSLIGAGGIGQPFGQIHPLAQAALRPATGYGISPFAGGF